VSPLKSPDVTGVVVAGGSSVRFGGPVPKQFMNLGGASVLERAVAALTDHPLVRGVVVVLPRADFDGSVTGRVRLIAGVLDVVPGGDTRAESCRNGVEATGPSEFVLVHDAARPMVPATVVDRVVRGTIEHGAAIPVIPVPDTIKESGDGEFVGKTLDRSRLFAAQTPQGSRGEWLLEAIDLAMVAGQEPTDEAMALEEAGRRVVLVEGDRSNFKITTPADLEKARRMMGSGGTSLRVGTGFDIHRFGEDRILVLGGVVFPGERGLVGHSDADVVLHAAMDALLGAAALGDIGALFPPDDPRFEGAASTGLASQVANLLRKSGFEIVNIDLTVLAERPRIRDRVEEMRLAVAESLAVTADRVGIKATTLEGIGSLGRGDGIACQATALIGVVEAER